jgi:retinoid hydroxylase
LVELPQDYQTRLGAFLAEMYREHGPIFRHKSPGRDDEVVDLVGPEANRFVMVSGRQKFSHEIGWGEAFNVKRLFGRGLLTMDGAEHDQHRKIMNPAFTLSYMERYLPLMHRVIRRRAAEWAESKIVDIHTELRKITFDIAAEALTGLATGEEVDIFRKLFVGLLGEPENINSYEEYMAYITELQQQLYAMLLPKIEERRQNPTDDVFGLLVQARDAEGKELSVEQSISHVNILRVAGHEEDKKHPYSLVGFGGGPRVCIGINFAQVEIKALASHILRHYELELVPGQHIAPVYDATSWPVNGIKMKVTTKTEPANLI